MGILNIIATFVFIMINFIAMFLYKMNIKKRTKILRILCYLLLAFNAFRYGFSSLLNNGLKYPVEFSTVAYFIVPIIILSKSKNIKCWAIYSAIMAGFFYYMIMISSGTYYYGDYPVSNITIAIINHSILYICGLVGLKTFKFKESDKYILISGIILVAANANTFGYTVSNKSKLLIYDLLEGNTFKSAFSNNLIPLYYLLLISIILLTIKLFLKINTKEYQKYLNSFVKKL